MKKNKIVVLGAGISGLTFAANANDNVLILEKDKFIGGHCRTRIEKGFTFDIGGPHILFSKNKKILNYMKSLLKQNIIKKKRNNKIFYKNDFYKYPFENGINQLDPKDKFICLRDYIFNNNKKPKNFKDWLYYNFGDFLTNEYLLPYNEKIWNTKANNMDFDWVEGRVPKPTIEEMIKTAVGITTEGYVHQLYFYYPKVDGYQEFTNALKDKCKHIKTNFIIKNIYKIGKKWIISNGIEKIECDKIVSTIPIIDLLKYLKDTPKKIIHSATKLKSNSLIQISIGLKNIDKEVYKYTAVYFPEKEFLFHRISFPHNFSEHCVPKNSVLINIEITVNKGDGFYEKNDTFYYKHCISKLKKIGFLKTKKNIIYKHIERTEYAYVVRDFNYKKNLQKCLTYISNKGLFSLGRNAEFTYINSDEAVRRALVLVEKFNANK